MNPALRPVEVDDLDRLLPIDTAYARTHAAPVVVNRGSLGFYARSGHAFVAEAGGRTLGVALAHAVWDGARPTVTVARIAVADDASDARRALLEAVVKSAYDAAVYDLVAEVPISDGATLDVLSEAWRERPTRRFERQLGSRAAPAAETS